jgi:hypothetical protein
LEEASNLAIVFIQEDAERSSRHSIKAVALDANLSHSYYYRSLANIQAKKSAEAKVDVLKYL